MPETPEPTDPAGLTVAGGRGTRSVGAVLGALAVIAVVVVGVIVVLGNDDGSDAGRDPGHAGSSESGSAPASSGEPNGATESHSPTSAIPPTAGPDDPGDDLPTLTQAPTGVATSLPFDDMPTDPAKYSEWFSEYVENLNKERS